MLGSNVPTVGGLPNGFHWAKEWGCESIQIYVTLSRRWEVPELSEKEITNFKSAWQNSPVKKVLAHVPYLVNLASPDKDLWQKSKARFTIELLRAQQFGVNFLVLHPGSYKNSNSEDGLRRMTEALNLVSSQTNDSTTKILLETMAGQGTSLGSSFEELAYMLEEVERPELFGICFDTAHVFISGYDIRGYKGYKKVLQEFDQTIGLDKIGAFHINDSKTKLGSRSDRHACIGEGELGLQVFHALVKDARFSKTPKILEIPERDQRSKDNLKLLRGLQGTQGFLPE